MQGIIYSSNPEKHPSIEDDVETVKKTRDLETIGSIRKRVTNYQNKIFELIQCLEVLEGASAENFGIYWNRFEDILTEKQKQYLNKEKDESMQSDIKYLEPRMFVKKFFGIMPQGRVEIHNSRIAIEIVFHNTEDYKSAYIGVCTLNTSLQSTENSRGALMVIENHDFIIINSGAYPETASKTMRHERQHGLYNLIGEKIDGISVKGIQESLIINSETLRDDIIRYSRPFLQICLAKAKNEIIAQTVGKQYNYNLLLMKGNNTSYDYTYWLRNYINKKMSQAGYGLTLQEFNNFLDELFMNEYYRVLMNMINIVNSNESKVDLLSFVPFRDWHRLEGLQGSFSRTDFCLNLSKNMNVLQKGY